jgi:hypothetical protein
MLFDESVVKAPPGQVLTEQDRKQVFRRLLCDLGGVSAGQLAGEFRKIVQAHGLAKGVTIYTLRHAVTTAMNRTPGMAHLELTYMTGHATNDILAQYVSLDPHAAMQRYFATIRDLLDAITRRARDLGLSTD